MGLQELGEGRLGAQKPHPGEPPFPEARAAVEGPKPVGHPREHSPEEARPQEDEGVEEDGEELGEEEVGPGEGP